MAEDTSPTRKFAAFMLREQKDKPPQAALEEITLKDLPPESSESVLVRVAYSSLNYKDGLAITGRAPIVRRFPMVAGIDLAGEVVQSDSDSGSARFAPGDQVLVNGYGLSERHWGGYAQFARVPDRFLLKLPSGLDGFQAMAFGTAGYTAALCVLALEAGGVAPAQGPILVTGASGGVGSVAVQLLAQRGFAVTACTGSPAAETRLKKWGAQDICARADLAEPGAPLASERWAGVVDSVGSQILANAIAQTRYGGTAAVCGLAAGSDLPLTVLPLILRGVRIQGVDSVMAPMAVREQAWALLAEAAPKLAFDQFAVSHGLAELPRLAEQILAGELVGRVVIDVNKDA